MTVSIVAPPKPFLLYGPGPLPAFSSSMTKSAAFLAGTPKGAAAGPEMNATMPILTFCANAAGASAAAVAAANATASRFMKLMMSISSYGSIYINRSIFRRDAMSPAESRAILFTNAQVFDGTGRTPFAGEVLVKGNRIDAVGEPGARLERQRAEVLDCGGATLMPGLVEAHAHLSWPSSIGRIINAMILPPEEHLLVTARNARVTLDAGFTSAYSAGSLGPRFEIALREEINGGWIPGPRLDRKSTR